MGSNGVRRESIVMRKEIANALARGLSVRKKMAADEGGSMSVHEVARRLKLSKQAVAKLYHGGKVLAWQSQKKGALHFPSWQFAQGKRFDGLEEVLIKLNEAQILDDWGKIGFFL